MSGYPAEAIPTMADPGNRDTDELAQRLRHWIVVGGYLVTDRMLGMFRAGKKGE